MAIQQHRLELVYAGPAEHVKEIAPVAIAAMDGRAGKLHMDSVDLNQIAHNLGAVAELALEDDNDAYNILPHEQGFRVVFHQTYKPFDTDVMGKLRQRCHQMFCGRARWRARLIGVEVIARIPPNHKVQTEQ